MIIFEDGTWLCDEDTTAPAGAMVINDNTRLAEEIKQHARVKLVAPVNVSDSLDDVQVIPINDRRDEILSELDRLDMQAVRPLRAIAAGTATETDKRKLKTLEEQATQLRTELANITAE